jgi:hypothetical protein
MHKFLLQESRRQNAAAIYQISLPMLAANRYIPRPALFGVVFWMNSTDIDSNLTALKTLAVITPPSQKGGVAPFYQIIS